MKSLFYFIFYFFIFFFNAHEQVFMNSDLNSSQHNALSQVCRVHSAQTQSCAQCANAVVHTGSAVVHTACAVTCCRKRMSDVTRPRRSVTMGWACALLRHHPTSLALSRHQKAMSQHQTSQPYCDRERLCHNRLQSLLEGPLSRHQKSCRNTKSTHKAAPFFQH